MLRRGIAAYGPAIALFVALLLGWELVVRVFDVATYFVPAPTQIVRSGLEVRATLPGHLRTTLIEAVTGLALSAVGAVALAAAMVSLPALRRALYPLLVVSQNVPLVVIAPLMVVWFGFGIMPKILVVEMVCFFPIAVSTTEGMLAADRDLLELVRSMGGSRWQALRLVRLPAALPVFFSGLKISASYAILAAVIGEWVGASSGLGLFITRSQASFRTDRVFVAVVVVAAISIALFAVVEMAARLALPWHYVKSQEDS
ncbi:MAG: ABC transporter permease [Dehalococcoidia bacterium]|nr:ABC transporter permease [Dehalococcoidia bacterium]